MSICGLGVAGHGELPHLTVRPVHLLPGNPCVQEVKMCIVGTGYFRCLANRTLRYGPLNLIIETIEELKNGENYAW